MASNISFVLIINIFNMVYKILNYFENIEFESGYLWVKFEAALKVVYDVLDTF